MPRSKKTMGGQQGQAVQAVSGQQYGRGVQQEALQAAMPAPQMQRIPAPPTPSPQPSPASPDQTLPTEAPAQPSARMTPEQAIQFLRGQGGILSAPDDNPNIPVTDGLSTGPGRGREVRQNESMLGDTLRRLAFQTNDPVFLELASKVSF